MKKTLAIAALLLGAALAPVASFAADGDTDRSHPKAFVTDSTITAKIKSKLAADHITSLGRIHVDTDADGIVYLSATARSPEAMDRAVEIARNTEHVVDVKNELRVRKDD
jgi:hyperosmotically inducible periplasmic protein